MLKFLYTNSFKFRSNSALKLTNKNNFINRNKVFRFCENIKDSNKFTSNVPTVKSGFQRFMAAIRKHVLKRLVMFRVLFYGSLVLIVFTVLRYSNNVNFAKNVTPIFFVKNISDLNTFYNVAGIIKPGSISYLKGTDEMNFILTDYEHELKIYHKGILPQNFLEGNTCIATGSITDVDRPFIFMSTKLMTDHSYNSDKWLNRKLEKSNSGKDGNLDDIMNMGKKSGNSSDKGFVNMK
jgi:cytochrome c-type biogenesis protein CcmE